MMQVKLKLLSELSIVRFVKHNYFMKDYLPIPIFSCHFKNIRDKDLLLLEVSRTNKHNISGLDRLSLEVPRTNKHTVSRLEFLLREKGETIKNLQQPAAAQ